MDCDAHKGGGKTSPHKTGASAQVARSSAHPGHWCITLQALQVCNLPAKASKRATGNLGLKSSKADGITIGPIQKIPVARLTTSLDKPPAMRQNK